MFKCALAFLALAIASRAQTPVVQTMLTAGITAAQTNVAVGAALPFQPTVATLTGYAAGTSYSVGDLVLYANGSTDLSNASIYAALVAHTGAATFTADNPQVDWSLVGNAAGLQNWVGSTHYAVGQLTIENSTVIKRIAAGISRPTYDGTESQYWTVLGNVQPPAVPVVGFVDSEQILISGSAAAGGLLTVSRGAGGTTGAVHAAGATVYLGTSAQFGALTPGGSCSGAGIQYVNTSLLQIYSCIAGTLVASASNQGSGTAATIGITSPNGNACSNTPVQAPSILFNGTIYTCQSGAYAPIAGTSSGTLTGLTAGTGLTGGGTSGNVPLFLAPAAIGTIGGVQALTPSTHQWIDSINTSGIAHTSQPASTDLSDVSSLVKLTTAQALTNKNLADGSNVFPTFNQNTTGTAGALAGTPTQCSGQLALGITASGNANCATIPAVLGFTPQNAAVANSSNDALGAAATAQSAAQTYTQTYASNASNLSTGTVSAGLIPLLNQNTTGQAGTAVALAATPTTCSSGQAPTGVLANGNATGCAAIVAGATTPAVSSLLKGNGSANGVVAAVPNTDYLPVASPTITGTATFNGTPLGTLALANAPASGLVASNGTTLGTATASQINSVLGYTPQNAATANANNAGIGNCTSGQYATGTAAGFTPPCAQPNYSQLAGTNPAAAGAALGLTAVQPTTQQSQFATSIPTSAPYTPCVQGTSPNLTFSGIPYVCSGTAYVANPGPAVGSLVGAAQGTASSTTLRDITSTADQGMLPSASNNVTSFNTTLALASGAGSGVLIPCGNNFTGNQYTFTGPINHIPSSTSLSMPGGRNGCAMVGNPSAAVTTAPGFLDLHGDTYNSILNARIQTVQSTGGFTFPTTLLFERNGLFNTGSHLIFNSAILGYNPYATIYSISSETNNTIANTFYQSAPNVPVLYLAGQDDYNLCATYSSNCQPGHVSNLSHFSFGDSYLNNNLTSGGDAIKDNLTGGGIGHHNYISDYTATSAGAAIGFLGSVTGGLNSSINWWGNRSEYSSINNNYGIHLESNTAGLAAYPGGGSPAGVACTVGQSYQYQGLAYVCPSGTLVFTLQSSLVGFLNVQGSTFADPTMIGCLYGDIGVTLTASSWAGNLCGVPTPTIFGVNLDAVSSSYFSLQQPLTVRTSTFNNIYEMLGPSAVAQLPANNEVSANPVQLGNGIGATKLYSGGGEIIGMSGLSLAQISNVPIPTITINTTGSTTCGYEIVALTAEWTTGVGRTIGTPVTSNSCAAAPNNTLTFSGAALSTYSNLIAPNAIGGYEVYRSMSGGSYFKIAGPIFPAPGPPGSTLTFIDNNLTASATVAPTVNTTGYLSIDCGGATTSLLAVCGSGGNVTVNAAGTALLYSGGTLNSIQSLGTLRVITNNNIEVSGWTQGGLTYETESTIASASTISPATPIVWVTGTTPINTMTPPTGCANGKDCQVTLMSDPATGPFTITTAGNFAATFTATVNQGTIFKYRSATSKWYQIH